MLDNQKIHPTPLDPSPQEQPSMQIVNKETHEIPESDTAAKTQAEPGLQPEIPDSVEPRKGGYKLDILKSIVYGGLTESITSLCTITSAAASGASTRKSSPSLWDISPKTIFNVLACNSVNVLALGVANLSSGLLLIVHSVSDLSRL